MRCLLSIGLIYLVLGVALPDVASETPTATPTEVPSTYRVYRQGVDGYDGGFHIRLSAASPNNHSSVSTADLTSLQYGWYEISDEHENTIEKSGIIETQTDGSDESPTAVILLGFEELVPPGDWEHVQRALLTLNIKRGDHSTQWGFSTYGFSVVKDAVFHNESNTHEPSEEGLTTYNDRRVGSAPWEKPGAMGAQDIDLENQTSAIVESFGDDFERVEIDVTNLVRNASQENQIAFHIRTLPSSVSQYGSPPTIPFFRLYLHGRGGGPQLEIWSGTGWPTVTPMSTNTPTPTPTDTPSTFRVLRNGVEGYDGGFYINLSAEEPDAHYSASSAQTLGMPPGFHEYDTIAESKSATPRSGRPSVGKYASEESPEAVLLLGFEGIVPPDGWENIQHAYLSFYLYRLDTERRTLANTRFRIRLVEEEVFYSGIDTQTASEDGWTTYNDRRAGSVPWEKPGAMGAGDVSETNEVQFVQYLSGELYQRVTFEVTDLVKNALQESQRTFHIQNLGTYVSPNESPVAVPTTEIVLHESDDIAKRPQLQI